MASEFLQFVDIDFHGTRGDIYGEEGWTKTVSQFVLHLKERGKALKAVAVGATHTIILDSGGDVSEFQFPAPCPAFYTSYVKIW